MTQRAGLDGKERKLGRIGNTSRLSRRIVNQIIVGNKRYVFTFVNHNNFYPRTKDEI